MSESHKRKTKKDADTDADAGDESAAPEATSMVDQATAAVSKAAGMTRDVSRRAAEAGGEQYARLSKGTRDVYRTAAATGGEWEAGLERYVRRNPITSLLATAGVGLLVGFILGRETAAPPPPPAWWRR